ncbi:hypothetical protein SEVIR_6G199200v4 [Setaria viridis]|uniref:Dof zinc finger protein n=2 Tax=Setaria TaxID=4554 RepID=A0A368RN31_SETIT|nr:dof zinc finger protein MNB1A [Setaria italica]XP_034598645.1 dof zinc finger protein MNB1A-like [Setaria viridis]RCV31616.1 hypothetical protein SETIT_6G192200v2 [Setaria italica]TKW10907.1 hypothetical protein SEVIR_6G199200v2 [Setaria viridis]
MQGAAAEPGRRLAQQQFAGVDLRRPKGYAVPAPAEGDPCPRCESRDTKFCYYNNYNTSQPRHFCKGCRRYWTKGGTLRNVPVGGGTRKKPSSSPPSSYAAAANANKPKKPSKKKRRVVVVAPQDPVAAPVAAPTLVAAPAADSAKTTTNETTTTTTNETTATTATPTTTDAASEITTELVVPAAEEEDSLAHLLQPDVALGLGTSDFPAAGKALDLEPDSFEWPAAFDLGGACWGSAGFADPDPAGLFLNLP